MKLIVTAKVAHSSSPSRTRDLIFWNTDIQQFQLVPFKDLDRLCDDGNIVGINRKGVLHNRYQKACMLGRDPQPNPDRYFVVVEQLLCGGDYEYRLVSLDGNQRVVDSDTLIHMIQQGCTVLGASLEDGKLTFNNAIPLSYKAVKSKDKSPVISSEEMWTDDEEVIDLT